MLKSIEDCGRPKNPQQFGRAIEHAIICKLIMSGGEVFLPTVDDDGIDVLVKRPIDKKIVQVQIKAKGKLSKEPCLFAAINHHPRPDYWFVFYSETYDKVWILSSSEFLSNAYQNRAKGNNLGKYSINFGNKGNRHKHFEAHDFSRILFCNTMSIFDPKPIEQHIQELNEHIQNELALCYTGINILETSDIEIVIKLLEKMISPDYQVIGNTIEAELIKKNQGRPIIRWDAKTFKKFDAIGSMYCLSQRKDKPIVIIENITDIPDDDSSIYDDPALVENLLLHSWKNDVINLTHPQQGSFQLNRSDYTVIFPVKPGDLAKLHHRIPDGIGIIKF